MRRRVAILICLPLGLSGCRPDILVDIATRIYPDGSIERRVQVVGRDQPAEEPPDTPGWLEDKTGLSPADPGLWDRVEPGAAGFRSEGVFLRAEDVPPALAHLENEQSIPDRQEVRVQRDDLVVLTRWQFQEKIGDPFGPARVDAAVDRIVELVSDYFRDELTSMYGDRMDSGGVDRFMRDQAGPIAREFLQARQVVPGPERLERRYDRWARILEQHGIPVAYREDPETNEMPLDFWEVQTGPLLDWAREGLAAAVSTAEETVEARHLEFIPEGDRLEEHLTDLVVQRWGSEEEALEVLDPLFQAIEGHYGSGGAPRYRFRCRLILPGTVLSTNGVADEEGLVWFFRGEELPAGDLQMLAESVEPNLVALRSLSARRSFSAADLLNLVDILGERDPEGVLREELLQAVEAGDLETLRAGAENLPADLQPLALELVELLRRP